MEVTQVVECLPSKHQSLKFKSQYHLHYKKKKKKEKSLWCQGGDILASLPHHLVDSSPHLVVQNRCFQALVECGQLSPC
jgi:23S rRNA A1618 N6-methylase RlmF